MLEGAEVRQGLWSEHLPAVDAFLAVKTQLQALPRYGASPHWLGLDYASAEAGLRMAGVEVTPELWTQVRLIEQGAIAALNGD